MTDGLSSVLKVFVFSQIRNFPWYYSLHNLLLLTHPLMLRILLLWTWTHPSSFTKEKNIHIMYKKKHINTQKVFLILTLMLLINRAISSQQCINAKHRNDLFCSYVQKKERHRKKLFLNLWYYINCISKRRSKLFKI